MNFFFITLLWQHILYLCTLFLVQGGKCTGYSFTEISVTTILRFVKPQRGQISRTQIQDMLPQQCYKDKVHILTRDFS